MCSLAIYITWMSCNNTELQLHCRVSSTLSFARENTVMVFKLSNPKVHVYTMTKLKVWCDTENTGSHFTIQLISHAISLKHRKRTFVVHRLIAYHHARQWTISANIYRFKSNIMAGRTIRDHLPQSDHFTNENIETLKNEMTCSRAQIRNSCHHQVWSSQLNLKCLFLSLWNIIHSSSPNALFLFCFPLGVHLWQITPALLLFFV